MSKEETAIDLIDRLLFFEDLAAKEHDGDNLDSIKKEISHGSFFPIDLIFCEHYYNATGRGNPLFALDAYKIHRENNLPVDHTDWFMVHFFLFSLGILKLEKDDIDSREIPGSVFEVFRDGYGRYQQHGRSLFTEYRKIKERTEIFKKIYRRTQQGKKPRTEFAEIAEEFGKKAKRIENIYYEERKILAVNIQDYINNKSFIA